MDETVLTQNQQDVFARACKRRGLHPEGFDVRAIGNGDQPSHTLIVVGKREYRYPYVLTDDTWAETFFRELNEFGDHGDGVKVATSVDERNSARP